MEETEFQVKIHPHKLKLDPVDNGWGCDGRSEQGGCKRGCSGYGQTIGWLRFKCIAGCNYDLCDLCLRHYAIQHLTL